MGILFVPAWELKWPEHWCGGALPLPAEPAGENECLFLPGFHGVSQ